MVSDPSEVFSSGGVESLQIQESYQIMELPEQTNLVKKKETTERQSELQYPS